MSKLRLLRVVLFVLAVAVLGCLPGGITHASGGAPGTIITVAGRGVGDSGPATSAELSGPTSVALDGAGNLYIADTTNCRVRKVSGGTITTVAGNGTCSYAGDGGPATSAGLNGPTGVALDGAGNLYIADYGNCRVREVSGGTITTVAGNALCGYAGDGGPATSARLYHPYGVALDGAGHLYISDQGNCVVREVSGGTITTVAGNGTCGYVGDGGPATSAELNHPYGVALDGAGNLYIADRDNCLARKVVGGTITTVAGTTVAGIGICGYTGDGGPATSAELNSPTGVALDGAGNLYISDHGNCLIRKVSGGTITTVAGDGTCGYAGDGGPATSAEFSGPTGVALDGAGNLYIVDSGNCRVREVVGGTITTVAGDGTCGYAGDGGPATSAELSFPQGVALDGAGDLYIADIANCVVRAVSGGAITTVAGNGTCGYAGDGGSATSAELNGPTGVALDGAGNLYIADQGNCRVRRVVAGIITTVAGNGTCGYAGDGGPATSAELNGPAGVGLDGAGDLYIADSANCVVREVSAGTIMTVAGNGTCGYAGDGGPATSAELNGPTGVVLDGAGDLYIADSANCVVREVSAGTIMTVAGNGTCGYAGDGGPATSAELNGPTGVALDGAGDLYIADQSNCRVREVSGGTITTVAGNGICGYAGDGGPATSAELDGPTGVALDGAGDLYIADQGNCVAREVSGGTITTVAGNGICGYFGDGGPATSAELNGPTGVALDGAGHLYIADQANCRVREVSVGTITTVAGNGTCGYGGDGGPATSAELNSPTGVALDGAGNLYIADRSNCRVREVSGGTITTVVGNGTCGYGGDSGPATSAKLNNPTGVALDGAGNLYIADYGNCRVREVSGGTIATVAGNGSCGYAGDGGPATSAKLNHTYGVAVDGAGNLYISDPLNCRVREVSGGTITTVAGNGTCGYAGDGGPATSAELNGPTGVALDGAGNLYIGDSGNCRVREVSGGTITTVAGNGICGYAGDGGPATSAKLSGPTGVALDGAGDLYIADRSNNVVREVFPPAAGTTPMFNPTFAVKNCNALPGDFSDPGLIGNPACTDDNAPGDAANSTTTLDIPSGNLNFSSVVTFTPHGTSITDGYDVPAGTKLGGVRWQTTLGLSNGPCNNSDAEDFVLYNVALPNNPSDPRSSTNIAWPRLDGAIDRFDGWTVGTGAYSGSPPGNGTGQFAAAFGGTAPTSSDGIHADGTSVSIQNYPSFLLDQFDPDFVRGVTDGPARPIVPLAVYGGQTLISGEGWAPLYIVQFDAPDDARNSGPRGNRSLASTTPLPSPLSLMTSSTLGQPSIAVLNDPTSTVVTPANFLNPTTDVCAPVHVDTMLLGKDPGGTYTRAANQSTIGTAFNLQYVASLRDLDQDGIENGLDTCPTIPNVGNPRTGVGENSNGMDPSCDPPNCGLAGSPDCDGDGFWNRQDNCPLVANGGANQTDSEVAKPADNGPRTDQIGDACDSGTATFMQNGHSVTVTLSSTVANGRYFAKGLVVPKCIGGTDADGDGYCAQDQDVGTDNNATRHKAWSGGLLQIDNDGDKFSTFQETYNGTDATKNCAQDSIANNEAPLDNWPLDFNDDQSVKSGDLSKYGALGVLNTVANTAAKQRLDLNDDGQVTTADLSKFTALGVFGSHCTPPSPFQQ
jgi:hypothetical protein